MPPTYVAWRVGKTYRVTGPARQATYRLAESIFGLLKRLQIRALAESIDSLESIPGLLKNTGTVCLTERKSCLRIHALTKPKSFI
jgi:hypothetical protein